MTDDIDDIINQATGKSQQQINEKDTTSNHMPDTDRKYLRNDAGDKQSYEEHYPTTYAMNTEHLKYCVNCNEATLRCHSGDDTRMTSNQMNTSMEQLEQAHKNINKAATDLHGIVNEVQDTVRDNTIADLQKHEWYRNLTNKQKVLVSGLLTVLTGGGTIMGILFF